MGMTKGTWTAVLALLLAAQADAATLLQYGVKEGDAEPYGSRVIVTEHYLRMDGGGGEDDGFVLLDRKAQVIYSVVNSDRTIFEIPARVVEVEAPIPIEITTETVPADQEVPTIAGRTPQRQRLLVNGKPCHEVVAVADLLPDAAAALGEFNRVLAGQKSLALSGTPAGMLDACDLALNIFHPEWPFQFGLPIRQWGGGGRSEVLMDFDAEFAAPPRLFLLPPDYDRFGG
jgi:hypothetical protein